jgi:phosphoribosyl 1,2-cyclic phosphodiesterase
MRIRFWGVRGSIPAPLLASQIKNKISIVLNNLTPEDIKNPESRERFLTALPPWLYGSVGGNTPCVSVDFGVPHEYVIFDAGSGIRELGMAVSQMMPRPNVYHLFFSHFHWDHLQGLPFFNPAYDPSVTINFYSPKQNIEAYLNGQMTFPYFPVPMDAMGSRKKFFHLQDKIELNNISIFYKKMNHPGDSYSYNVTDGKHRFIYATDSELSADDFIKTDENSMFFQDADLIIIDSQYTLGEFTEKYNWGHSAFSLAVDFASNWGIKHMVLFHHDPNYNDRKLFNNLQAAKWYLEKLTNRGTKISLAMEGEEIIL